MSLGRPPLKHDQRPDLLLQVYICGVSGCQMLQRCLQPGCTSSAVVVLRPICSRVRQFLRRLLQQSLLLYRHMCRALYVPNVLISTTEATSGALVERTASTSMS